MTLHLILLALLVVFLILAVVLTDLLRAAIALAVASAVLSILLFWFRTPYAAVFELSVCAGLVMVLFVASIGLTRRAEPENEEKGKSLVLILPVLILIALAVIDIAVFAFISRRTAMIHEAAPPTRFGDVLWRVRWLDVLAQVAIIVTGVFAILALFRREGIVPADRNEAARSSGEENHG
jgi:NADH-quinone oxidoreductase subunit J